MCVHEALMMTKLEYSIVYRQYFYLISSFLAPWNRLPVTKSVLSDTS